MSIKWKEYKTNLQIRPVFVNGVLDHYEGRIIMPIVTIQAPTADQVCADLNKILKERK